MTPLEALDPAPDLFICTHSAPRRRGIGRLHLHSCGRRCLWQVALKRSSRFFAVFKTARSGVTGPAARRVSAGGRGGLCGARRDRAAVELAEQHAENRIAAKFIVVVEVLIAERQAEDALRHQGLAQGRLFHFLPFRAKKTWFGCISCSCRPTAQLIVGGNHAS